MNAVRRSPEADMRVKLSAGNFISLGIVMATVIAAAATFQAELNAAKADLARTGAKLERLELQALQINERLNRIEVAFSLSGELPPFRSRRGGE